MRILLRLASFLGLAAALLAVGTIGWNNRPAAAPGEAELRRSMERAIQWLEINRQAVLARNNVYLWRMVAEAASLSGDAGLRELSDEYLGEYENFSYANPYALETLLRPLLFSNEQTRLTAASLVYVASLADYQQHHVFAVSCNAEIADWPLILEQQTPGFCDWRMNRPTCGTHQLYGVRLQLARQCGDPERLQLTQAALEARIRRELVWDPRVVDVYLQRLLMLAASDAKNQIKTVWIRRMLAAQNEDGGWDDFQGLLPLAGGLQFGFSGSFFTVTRPKSGFHATAQGILLIALLLEENSAADAGRDAGDRVRADSPAAPEGAGVVGVVGL